MPKKAPEPPIPADWLDQGWMESIPPAKVPPSSLPSPERMKKLYKRGWGAARPNKKS